MHRIVILLAAVIGTVVAPFPFTDGQKGLVKTYHDRILGDAGLMDSLLAACNFDDFLANVFAMFYVGADQTITNSCALAAAAADILRELKELDVKKIAAEAAASAKFTNARGKCAGRVIHLKPNPNADDVCPSK